MNNENLMQFIKDLNCDPNPNHINKNDDGSLYIPISIVQTMLDEIFLGQWSFVVTDTEFGRKWARGYGKMQVVNPITGQKIIRSGDAGISLVGNLRIDSPRLEAMILLSCAKKLGRIFGRDLNRTKDDAPLPIIQVDKQTFTTEEKRIEALIDDCETSEELETYKHVVPKGLKNKYDLKLKNLLS
jgi:hypothetical protein